MDEILSSISKLFKKCGIKCINMDDIARELGISKKTLYQHFENKNEIIYKVIQYEMQSECNDLHKLFTLYPNAIDQLHFISKYVVIKLYNLQPSLIYDINKYYPQIWGKLKNQRAEYIHTIIEQNFQLGMKQGIYRENLNTDVIAVYYTFLFDIKGFEKFREELNNDFDKMFKTLFMLHIRGIATAKGVEYLEKCFNNLKN